VAVDTDGGLIGHRLEPAQPRVEQQVATLVASLRAELGTANAEVPVVATGYGRKLIKDATRQVTELTCHARGVWTNLERTGTLVDIGGQDSKVIAIGPRGSPIDFTMNDKCAAGTGRFLEHTAARLGVPLAELGERALAAPDEETISSTCTVFAESEIISLIAHGVEIGPILRGLHRALVSRISAMIHFVSFVPPLMLSGGVAQNVAVRQMLREATRQDIVLPQHPQLMGAYGAALVGLDPS
jgi:predicted CoA-substrate-specific enzyme activase